MGYDFLSTPYTLYPGGLRKAFEEAALLTARLTETTGGIVYSPIVSCHPLAEIGKLDPLDLTIWLPICEAMLKPARTLIVAHLTSWESSKGMAHEIKRAEEWGIPIFDCDVQTLSMKKRQAGRFEPNFI